MSLQRYFLLLFFLLSFTQSLYAEISSYESTDNSGQNKKERIDTLDKYMVDLSASLKKMESKLDENSVKLKTLDETLKILKSAEAKRSMDELEQKSQEKKKAALSSLDSKDNKDSKGQKNKLIEGDPKEFIGELDKLKTDIVVLKNKDIEKLRADLDELTDTVKALQNTLRQK